VNGGSKSVTVTIQQAELPTTGQDSTPLWVLGVLAALSGAAGVCKDDKREAEIPAGKVSENSE